MADHRGARRNCASEEVRPHSRHCNGGDRRRLRCSVLHPSGRASHRDLRSPSLDLRIRRRRPSRQPKDRPFGRAKRRGLDAGPSVGELPLLERRSHRTGLQRQVPRPFRAGRLPVRRLRDRGLLLDRQVRLEHGLAKLHEAPGRLERRRGVGLLLGPSKTRGAVREVRVPPWPCVRRRSSSDEKAVLHQLRVPRV